MRDTILETFYLLPQSSIYVCSRLIKRMKPSKELFLHLEQLTTEGLLIEHKRYHRLPPVYELSKQAQEFIYEPNKLCLTPYQLEVVEKTKSSELEFATNQQKAYDLIFKFQTKKCIYLSTLMLQELLNISYIDTMCVLAELFKTNAIEPIDLLWKIKIKKDI